MPTIAEILRHEKGFSIGVVSTVPFTHATPAAQVSHNVSRNNYHAIGDEIVMQTQPEVVIGGGYASNTYLPSAALTYLIANPKSPYVFVQRQAGVDGSQALAKAAASRGAAKEALRSVRESVNRQLRVARAGRQPRRAFGEARND